MAKNLLIRELSEEVNEALDRYKEEHSLKQNTDAAKRMLKDFHEIGDELIRIKREYLALERKYSNLVRLLKNRTRSENELSEYLQNQEL